MYFNKPIRLIELFAGIGSQAKALTNLGLNFEHWRVCEFDAHAVRSYNAVHNTQFVPSDITKISATDLGITDTNEFTYLLTYSFPCQDLSCAGRGAGMEKGSGTRSGLLWEVERLLNECDELPQVLLMENVPQVHGKKNKEHFDKWIEFLASKGYSNYWQDLNAKDYGVPQSRNRCYMVSILGDHSYKFPTPVKLELTLKDIVEKEVDEKYYLSNEKLRTINRWKSLERPLERVYGKNSIANTLTTRSGAECGSLATYSEQFEETTNIVPLLETEELSSKIRKLTPKEHWKLMGFDDVDVEKAAKVCSNSRLYKQAGNSIVVDVLMAIFKELFIVMDSAARKKWLDDLLK